MISNIVYHFASVSIDLCRAMESLRIDASSTLKKHKQEVTSSRSRTRMGGMSTVIGGLARISDEAPELLDVVPLKEGALEGACPVA
jgi:hypothetical protein